MSSEDYYIIKDNKIGTIRYTYPMCVDQESEVGSIVLRYPGHPLSEPACLAVKPHPNFGHLLYGGWVGLDNRGV